MEPIKKNGLDREVKRHEMNVEKIQTIVNDMIEMGFVFETGELRDLGSSCVILHDRAIEMAQKDSSRIRISFKRDADYKETLYRLNEAIENNAKELKKTLLHHTSTPLEIEAFEIRWSHWIFIFAVNFLSFTPLTTSFTTVGVEVGVSGT